jgi:hypothetical protein
MRGLDRLRREWDSNPRYLAVNTLSKRARSATLTPLREMRRKYKLSNEILIKKSLILASTF